MTTLTLERLIPQRPSATPPLGTTVAARTALIIESVRAARALDSVVSPKAQKRILERFASRL